MGAVRLFRVYLDGAAEGWSRESGSHWDRWRTGRVGPWTEADLLPSQIRRVTSLLLVHTSILSLSPRRSPSIYSVEIAQLNPYSVPETGLCTIRCPHSSPVVRGPPGALICHYLSSPLLLDRMPRIVSRLMLDLCPNVMGTYAFYDLLFWGLSIAT